LTMESTSEGDSPISTGIPLEQIESYLREIIDVEEH
jgi:hypothetical protein